MNTILRHSSIQTTGIIMRQADMSLSVRELREKVVSQPGFIQRVLGYCSKIRSTKMYWRQRCPELLTMVSQIGKPTIFFTLSAADEHWPDIYRLLCEGTNLDRGSLTNEQRRKLMRDNPLITSWFFERRSTYFLNGLMKEIFKVKDFWVRYEWQWRGSPHMHGLLWLNDAPKFEEASLNNETMGQIKAQGRVSLALCPVKH